MRRKGSNAPLALSKKPPSSVRECVVVRAQILDVLQSTATVSGISCNSHDAIWAHFSGVINPRNILRELRVARLLTVAMVRPLYRLGATLYLQRGTVGLGHLDVCVLRSSLIPHCIARTLFGLPMGILACRRVAFGYVQPTSSR